MAADKRRGGRPATGPLLGTCEEHHELVALMDLWRERADLSRADVFRRLTADHFGGEAPKRTAVYDMFKGKDLNWKFIDAVADICTETTDGQEALSAEAHSLWIRAKNNPTPLTTPSDNSQQRLIDALSELAEVQAELLRVRQLRETSDQTIISANQMVMMLLMVIGQLQSQIAGLNHQINNLVPRQPNHDARTHLEGKLTQANEQHTTAQTELGRAQQERDEALDLSNTATIEARALQEDVQLLREVNNLEVDEDLEKPLPPLPVFGGSPTPNGGVGDISEALEKIRHRLDYSAEDLENVRSELREKSTLDESVIPGEIISQDQEVNSTAKTETVESEDEEADEPETPEILPSRAALLGYKPSQVLRYADAALRKNNETIGIYLLLSEAIPLQTEEERKETRRLLTQMRRGEQLLEIWDAAVEDSGNHALGPLRPPGVSKSHPELESFTGHGGIEEIRGRKPWEMVAQLMGVRITPNLQPRFGVITMRDGTQALLISANSNAHKLAEICGRVLGRLDFEIKAYIVNVSNLPEGDMKDGILAIRPWYLRSREGGPAIDPPLPTTDPF
ncbi:hypothetical protein QF035_000088 [Streptomyces umbrinus]|uniref:Uncharacterized protein n=1 Tax=Streptomyces umbrinus TaxID=67370 RepID=A0ABU0SG28_9ACTN|nr:hypothetical protein [Streptomyces umbrinus]MDQ1022506.1 hypothetical protein [Streptomyces umbrinus]